MSANIQIQDIMHQKSLFSLQFKKLQEMYLHNRTIVIHAEIIYFYYIKCWIRLPVDCVLTLTTCIEPLTISSLGL